MSSQKPSPDKRHTANVSAAGDASHNPPVAVRRRKLEQMLQQDPGDAFLHYAIANEDLQAGHAETGLSRLMKLIQLCPDYVGAYFRAGQVLAELGRTEQALDVLGDGVSVADRVGDQHAAAEMKEFRATISDSPPRETSPP